MKTWAISNRETEGGSAAEVGKSTGEKAVIEVMISSFLSAYQHDFITMLA